MLFRLLLVFEVEMIIIVWILFVFCFFVVFFCVFFFFFFQAEDGIRDVAVTGVQTCALPIFGQRSGVVELVHRFTVDGPCYVRVRGTDGKRGAPGYHGAAVDPSGPALDVVDRKSTRLNSSHGYISYAVFCLKKKKITQTLQSP